MNKFFKDFQDFVVFEKNLQVLIYSKLHEKNHVITFYDMQEKIRDS